MLLCFSVFSEFCFSCKGDILRFCSFAFVCCDFELQIIRGAFFFRNTKHTCSNASSDIFKCIYLFSFDMRFFNEKYQFNGKHIDFVCKKKMVFEHFSQIFFSVCRHIVSFSAIFTCKIFEYTIYFMSTFLTSLKMNLQLNFNKNFGMRELLRKTKTKSIANVQRWTLK